MSVLIVATISIIMTFLYFKQEIDIYNEIRVKYSKEEKSPVSRLKRYVSFRFNFVGNKILKDTQ